MKSKIARKLRRLNTRQTRIKCESALFVCLIIGFAALEANCCLRQTASRQAATITSVLPPDYQGHNSAGLRLYKRASDTVATYQSANYLDILSVERATLETEPQRLIRLRHPEPIKTRQVTSQDRTADPANDNDERWPHLAAEIPVLRVPNKVLPVTFDQAGAEMALLYRYPATASPPLTTPIRPLQSSHSQ